MPYTIYVGDSAQSVMHDDKSFSCPTSLSRLQTPSSIVLKTIPSISLGLNSNSLNQGLVETPGVGRVAVDKGLAGRGGDKLPARPSLRRSIGILACRANVRHVVELNRKHTSSHISQ